MRKRRPSTRSTPAAFASASSEAVPTSETPARPPRSAPWPGSSVRTRRSERPARAESASDHGTFHDPAGDRPPEEARRQRLAHRDVARDDVAVRQVQGEAARCVVVVGHDADERPDDLAVDHPPVVVDEVEAAVLAHAERLELDLVAMDERERLHRRDRDPRDGALHHTPPA